MFCNYNNNYSFYNFITKRCMGGCYTSTFLRCPLLYLMSQKGRHLQNLFGLWLFTTLPR